MSKTILVTGATDGIGYTVVKELLGLGYRLLAHGRSSAKLAKICEEARAVGPIETFAADLADLCQARRLSEEIKKSHKRIDVLINNAGVFTIANQFADNGVDQRFLVNTIAPYLLTKELLGCFPQGGRVVNVGSAAQKPVDLQALTGEITLDASNAYAQSKLALTMWTFHMAKIHKSPLFLVVNPGSFLGSKMVKEAYGMVGNDLSIGTRIIVEAAIAEKFKDASGKYYDNDVQAFAHPNREALIDSKNKELVEKLEGVLSNVLQG